MTAHIDELAQNPIQGGHVKVLPYLLLETGGDNGMNKELVILAKVLIKDVLPVLRQHGKLGQLLDWLVQHQELYQPAHLLNAGILPTIHLAQRR